MKNGFNKEKRMKKQNFLGFLAVGAVVTGVGVFAQAAQASTVIVYRLYNINTGEHFYTSSELEESSLNNNGWNYEGTAFVASTSGVPVYRIYNPNVNGGDHYYTKSKFEADSLVKLGWHWDNNQKPVFYSSGATKLYVSYNPNAQSGAHNYTTSNAEQGSLLSVGWKYGAVAWNVAGSGNANAKNPNPTPHTYTKGGTPVVPSNNLSTPGNVTGPGNLQQSVYVVDNGTTKVYWYASADITPKPTAPVIQMTEAQAIAMGLHHSAKE
jgi:hypothetical protein